MIKMQFELNELHRNVSDEELIQDVVFVANKLGRQSLTIDEYEENGKFHSSTLRRRFGSWKNILKMAGLIIEQKNFYISNDEYAYDLKRVAESLGKITVKNTEYRKYGKYDAQKMSARFGSWENALLAAGLQPTGYTISVKDDELLEEIERLWIQLGRQPTSTDIRAGLSRYGLTTFLRHFGSWRSALETFVNYVNEEKEQGLVVETVPLKDPSNNPIMEIKHKTKRDINLRLRFLVMNRDNFKCCMCGASPAKDPSVVLHIDHIIPWSKGGETVIENLQTLCSKCNLGKSDLYEEE